MDGNGLLHSSKKVNIKVSWTQDGKFMKKTIYINSDKNHNMKKAQTPNKVLPKAGLNGFDWTIVQSSTLVLRLIFCAKISAFGNTRSVV